jgi:hypothetical protein
MGHKMMNRFFEIEESPGHYNESKFEHLDKVIEIANKYNIRIKFCLAVTRDFNPSKSPFYNKVYDKKNGGIFSSFSELIDTDKGRLAYLNRVKAYANRYKNNPTIYCWELWNEMSAISGGNWFDFTQSILDSMKTICPKQLSSQTLGSLDRDFVVREYSKYLTLKNNDIICVHRYLDSGAQFPIVQGPIDISLWQAVKYISNSAVIKPLFVNETGAVKPQHSGPSKLYAIDTAGTMLHDMLFAPFFSGAAGPGSIWYFWEYVTKNKLWYHYERFNHAILGINPILERFNNLKLTDQQVNFYVLAGKKTTLIWCRDATNNYITELSNGEAPSMRKGIKLALKTVNVNANYKIAKAYNPWTDKWVDIRIINNTITIPPFLRSVVIKLI